MSRKKDFATVAEDFKPNDAETMRLEFRRLVIEKVAGLELDVALRDLSKKHKIGVKKLRVELELVANQIALENAEPPQPPQPPTEEQKAEQRAKQEAEKRAEKERADDEAKVQKRADEIGRKKNIPRSFQKALRVCFGYITDSHSAAAIIASHVGRLLPKSSGYVVLGSSSSGKSDLVLKAAEFLNPDDVILATTCSDQALYYLGDIRHKYFVGGELRLLKPGEDDPWQQSFRQLVSENKISRMIVEKDEEGKNRNVIKETQGPAVFILTTSLEPQSFNDEFINRLSVIRTDDSDEMTRRVLKAQARSEMSQPTERRRRFIETEIAAWRSYHASLQFKGVIVPFAKHIVPLKTPVTARRLFKLLFAYIKIFALMHQANRQIQGDCVEASLDDYKLAYEVVNNCAPRVGDAVGEGDRAFFKKLKELFDSQPEFTRAEIQAKIAISEQKANRHLNRLTKAGRLKCSGEKGRAYTYSIVLNAPALEPQDLGLIEPEQLERACSPIQTYSNTREQVDFSPAEALRTPAHLITRPEGGSKKHFSDF